MTIFIRLLKDCFLPRIRAPQLDNLLKAIKVLSPRFAYFGGNKAMKSFTNINLNP